MFEAFGKMDDMESMHLFFQLFLIFSPSSLRGQVPFADEVGCGRVTCAKLV